MHVIAVDPGTDKCGIAVLTEERAVVLRKVVPREIAVRELQSLAASFRPAVLVMGDRTGSKAFLRELETAGFSAQVEGIHTVDEHLSSLEARDRYFLENPPRGLRRLIPRTMQTPPVLYDDYVAVVLAERYLTERLGR